MRIFKNPWFIRFASKEGIADSELKGIVDNVLEPNRAEADLGGGVYKVRVARPGKGKSGGYRVIVFFKSRLRTVFVYGFAKSGRANIGQAEERGLKKDAKYQLALTEDQIKAWLERGTLVEVL